MFLPSCGFSSQWDSMEVTLPQKTMSDSDIMEYVSISSIPNFRGVMMRDELPIKPLKIECGVLKDRIGFVGSSKKMSDTILTPLVNLLR